MQELAAATIYGIDLPAALLDALDEDRREEVYFADVRTDARALGDLLTTTRATYTRVGRTQVDRLPNVGDPRVLSAVRQRVRQHVRDSAAAARDAYDAGDTDRLARAVDAMHKGARGLQTLSPKAGELGEAAARKPRRRQRGKARTKLRGLPRDWDVQLLRTAPNNDRPWIAALALTGARPGVLADSGIYVCVAGEHLLLTVPGSKRGGGVFLTYPRGQDTVADAMAGYVSACGGALHLRMPYNRAKKRHERIARHSFGRPLPLTAHRHQFHADLKADGVSRETIARATGKTSTAGITVYATASQGRSGRGLALHNVQSLEVTSQPALDGVVDTPDAAPPPPSPEPEPAGTVSAGP